MTDIQRNVFVDYSNETSDLTIEILMKRGFSAYEASAYLSKLNIQKLFANDNDCTNVRFNPELRLPPDRMKNSKYKKGDK